MDAVSATDPDFLSAFGLGPPAGATDTGLSVDPLAAGANPAGSLAVGVDDPDFQAYFGITPEKAQNGDDYGDLSIWESALNQVTGLGLSLATGAGQGVEIAGALTELVFPEIGDQVRQSGRSMQQYLTEKMPKSYQDALNRSWLDLSSQGAWQDYRSWLAGLAQTVPYMIGTGGAGEVGALALRAAGVGAREAAVAGGEAAAKQAALAAARKVAYPTVAGAAGAGEAAAGAAQATDQAGLSLEERLSAMRTAAPVGAIAGAAFGHGVERLMGDEVGGLIRRGVTGAVSEAVEEGGTQLGTEFGKHHVGLDFSLANVAEAAVGGAVLGTVAGAVVSHPSAKADTARELAGTKKAEEQAVIDREAAQAEADTAKREASVSDAIEFEYQRHGQQPLALPSPEQFGRSSSAQPMPNQAMPVPPGPQQTALPAPEQFGRTSTPTLLSNQQNYPANMSEADRAQVTDFDTKVNGLNAQLQEVTEKIQTRGKKTQSERLALRQQAKTLYGQYIDAVNRRDEFLAGRQITLPGLATDVDPMFAQKAEQDEVIATLDEHNIPVDEAAADAAAEALPLMEIHDKSVARSQQARAAAVARWAKNKAAETPETGTGAPPVEVPAPGFTSGGNLAGGSAEKQAVNSTPTAGRRASRTTTAEQAALTPPDAQPAPAGIAPVAQAMAQPTPDTVGQPQPGQTPSSPAAAGASVPESALSAPQVGIVPAPSTRPIQAVVNQQAATDKTGQSPTPRSKKPLSAMTPRERLLTVLSKQTRVPINTVLSALQDAAQNNNDPALFKLVQRVAKAFPSSKKKPTKLTVVATPLSANFQGLYNPKSDTIFIDPSQAEDLVQAVLHEVVHAATIVNLRLSPDMYTGVNAFRNQISKIMEDAKDWWDLNKWAPSVDEIQGFRSVEEFVAEAMTNTGFADKLDILFTTKTERYNNSEQGAKSIWSRIRNMVRFKVASGLEANSNTLFDGLMDMVLDGSLIPDGNRQEALQQLDALGLSQANALFTTLRSALRTNSAASVATGGTKRVWKSMLRLMGVGQIAQSYGWLGQSYALPTGTRMPLTHDTVNVYNQLIAARGGMATSKRALGSRIMNVYKNAVQSGGGSAYLDDFMMSSRVSGIHGDLPPVSVPAPGSPPYSNTAVTGRPGGMAAWREQSAAWNDPRMTPEMKNAYRLIRDYFYGDRNDKVIRMMTARLRWMVSAAAADRLEAATNVSTRKVTVNHGGIEVSWQKIPNHAELTTFVSRLGLSTARQAEVVKAMMDVHDALGKSEGPYIPMRRHGDYYMYIISPNRTANMTLAQYERMLADNRAGAGDLEVVSARQDPTTGLYNVVVRNVQVTGHDTELEAEDALAAAKKNFATRRVPITVRSARAALGSDHAYEALGIQNQSIRALQEALRKSMPGPQGEEAANNVMKTYLEKLPDTSIRKSELKSRKIAGASRDMQHVLSQAIQGNAYFAAQATYGHKISRNITTNMSEDIKTLHDAGMTQQANDLTALQNHFKMRDRSYDRLAKMEEKGVSSNVSKWWQRAPQLAGAWLLTGPGTAITNSMQTMLAHQWLAARFGQLKTSGTMAGVVKDVFYPLAKETMFEWGRFLKTGPKAIRDTVRGLPLPTFKDPIKSPVEHVIDRLSDANEKQLLRDLTADKKIDLGMVADLQSMAENAGRAWAAVQHVSDAAFILPQAIETNNRIVTALSTYRLYKKANPTMSYDELRKNAADAIDQTQFNYSYENRPLAFQNDYMRAALTFKTYPQAMWYTVVHNIIQMIHGGAGAKNKAEANAQRWIAMKFLGGITMTTMASAGLMGILAFDPFYAAAVALAALLTDDPDPEQALREAMSGFNKDLVNAFLRGAPYGAHIADTGRMGLPQFFPVQELIKVAGDPNQGWGEFVGTVGEWFLGAPGSITGQMAQAAGAMANGNYAQGAQLMTPKMFGINDMTRAYVYANQGAEDSRGYAYVQSGEISTGEWITRALGFEPPQIADAKGQRRAYFADVGRLTDARNSLIEDFATAQLEGDFKKRDKTLNKIVLFNSKNPAGAITQSGLISSIRSRAMGEYMVGQFGVNASTRMQQQVAADVAERYQ